MTKAISAIYEDEDHPIYSAVQTLIGMDMIDGHGSLGLAMADLSAARTPAKALAIFAIAKGLTLSVDASRKTGFNMTAS